MKKNTGIVKNDLEKLKEIIFEPSKEIETPTIDKYIAKIKNAVSNVEKDIDEFEEYKDAEKKVLSKKIKKSVEKFLDTTIEKYVYRVPKLATAASIFSATLGFMWLIKN